MGSRYHKDPYDQVDGDFLGEAQWEWLEKELYESKASFNVIVSGIQVLPEDRFFGGENWHRFPQQRLRLLHLILKSNAKGVVLLSGDVHFAEINQIQCDGGTSRRSIITEVTNSGMTHSWDHNPSSNSKWPSIPVLIFHVANRLLPMEFRRKIDHFYSKLHFGELAFYWNEAPFPVMTVKIIGMDNKAHLEYNISSISYIDGMMNTSTSNITCRPIREMPKPLAYIRHGLYNSISWVLVGIYPFTLSLILALLLYVAMKIRERCHKRNVIKVD
jgi:alkaline phosphatase D